MNQRLVQISLLVDDYDKAIHYYTNVLGFQLLEDTHLSLSKRWVVVKPGGKDSCKILLAKASNEEQFSRIGNQTGGRVFLFLYTDDCKRDYENYTAKKVEFLKPVTKESYGYVTVFKDLYGNLWDLIQPVNM
jgi:catechol 2,3-dioxygenase-like lactoylglutathione lyase family enzyme